MKNENIVAWITKYALTTGIQKVCGTVLHEISSDMFSYDHPDTGWKTSVHGKDWHRTPEAALERAEEMREAKIASLKKSLAKFEAMKFKIEE